MARTPNSPPRGASKAENPPKIVGWIRSSKSDEKGTPIKRILKEEGVNLLVETEKMPGGQWITEDRFLPFTEESETSPRKADIADAKPDLGAPVEGDFIKQRRPSGDRLVPIDAVETSLGPDVKPGRKARKPKAEENDLSLDLKAINLHMAGLNRNMKDAERNYLEAYKRFQLNKQSEDEEEPKTLKGLREEFEKQKEEYDKKLDNLITQDILKKSVTQPINMAGLMQHHRETILSQSTKDHERNRRNADLEVVGERMQKDMRDNVPQDKEREMKRQEGREERARALAEKYGLTSEREAMLVVERRYAGALLLNHRSGTPIPSDVEESYVAARLEWRKALTSAPLTEEDRLAAKFIAVRDTSLRLEQVRAEAREFALNEKEQKPYRKALAWSKRFGNDLIGAFKESGRIYASIAQATGSGLTRSAEFVTRKKFNVEHRARASRILGSAVLMSSLMAVTGGAAAVPVTLDFLARALRGGIGIMAGTKAAKAAGQKYEQLRGGAVKTEVAGARQAYAEVLKTKELGELSAEQLESEAETYARGRAATASRKSHEAKRTWIEVGAATAVGGAAAMGSSFVINPAVEGLSSLIKDSAKVLEDVIGNPENAAGVIDQQTAGGSDMTNAEAKEGLRESLKQVEAMQRLQEMQSTSETVVKGLFGMEGDAAASSAHPEPGLPVAGATIHLEGEGTNRLFLEMKERVHHNLGTDLLDNPPPALRHFMETNVNDLSREVGDAAYGTRGMLTHAGDQFYVDENLNIVYQPADGEPQIFLENDPNAPEGFIRHDLDARPTPEVPAAQSQAVQAERGSATESAPSPVEPAEPMSDSEVDTTEGPNAVDETDSFVSGPSTEHLGQPLGGPEGLPDSDVPQDLQTGHASTLGQLLQPEGAPSGAAEPLISSGPSGTAPPPNGAHTLGELMQQQESTGGSGGGVELDPLSWTPEQGLPHEPALFTPQSDFVSRLAVPNLRGDIVFAHAPSPQASLAYVQEQGPRNPGVNYVYDSSEYDAFGTKTPRISIIRYGDNGYPQEFIKNVVDRNGDPITSITPDQLRARIA